MGRAVRQKISIEIEVYLTGTKNDGGIDDIDLDSVTIGGRDFMLPALRQITGADLIENVALYASDPGAWERDDTQDD